MAASASLSERPLVLAPRLGDERLAQRVGGGDGRAFTALYERYHQPLFRYCRMLLGDDGDAQDALQSTFERAFAALRQGRRDAPVRPWLYRIAHNESVSLIRRRRPAPVAATALEHARSAEEAAADRGELATLLADLRELPERARGALVMRELAGLRHAEIAEAFGISAGAAKQAIFEARRGLAELAEGRAMRCEDVCRTISDGDGRALRGRRIRAHLRDCAGCRAFAAAIPDRRAQLRALAPGLPPAAAATVLARAGGAAHGPGAAAGLGGGLAAGAAGKGVVAVWTGAKLVSAAAVVLSAGGVVALTHAIHSHPVPRSAPVPARQTQRLAVRATPAGRLAVPSRAHWTAGARPATRASATARAYRGRNAVTRLPTVISTQRSVSRGTSAAARWTARPRVASRERTPAARPVRRIARTERRAEPRAGREKARAEGHPRAAQTKARSTRTARRRR